MEHCCSTCSRFEASYKGTITTGADPPHSKRISISTKPLGGILEHVACLFEVAPRICKAVLEHREDEGIEQKHNNRKQNTQPKTNTHKGIQHERTNEQQYTHKTKNKTKTKNTNKCKAKPTTNKGFEQESAGAPGTVQGPYVAFGEPRAAFRGPFWDPFWSHFGTIFEHFFGALK